MAEVEPALAEHSHGAGGGRLWGNRVAREPHPDEPIDLRVPRDGPPAGGLPGAHQEVWPRAAPPEHVHLLLLCVGSPPARNHRSSAFLLLLLLLLLFFLFFFFFFLFFFFPVQFAPRTWRARHAIPSAGSIAAHGEARAALHRSRGLAGAASKRGGAREGGAPGGRGRPPRAGHQPRDRGLRQAARRPFSVFHGKTIGFGPQRPHKSRKDG